MKNQDPISEVLTRGVSEAIVRQDLENLLRSGKKIKLYLGIDPTSTRLHLGNAIPLRKLREFQDLGHKVIFLVGNFTALIGDTSDKTSMRQPLTQEQIEENFKTYKTQASKILDFSKAEILYNGEWLSKLTFKDILELANKFTVQQMIERDMYQERIKCNRPIGLHEFLYPLMQGYDSVFMDVDLEVGGNDQLFNMLSGRTLQKIMRGKDKHVITMQLLEGTDGRKMAKSYNNTINIADPPTEQYGKIMSMGDDLILKYFELCTRIPMSDIREMDAAMRSGDNPRDFKMRLAREIVTQYHSASAAQEAESEFKKVFQKKEAPTDVPIRTVAKSALRITDLLTEVDLASSKKEAQRLVEGGGVRFGDQKISDPFETITLSKEPVILQVGKRKFVRIARE